MTDPYQAASIPKDYTTYCPVTYLLLHVSVHGGDGEVSAGHLLGQPVHLPSGVAEDNSLPQ